MNGVTTRGYLTTASALDLELDGVEGGLQEMDGAVVGGDDEVAIGPLRLFVSADEQFEGEAFENEIVSGGFADKVYTK